MKTEGMFQNKLWQKVQTICYIAECLPATLSDLCVKVKDRYEVRTRITVTKRLQDLKDLGMVYEGNCPCCKHKVWMLHSWQKFYRAMTDGSTKEDAVFIFTNGKLDSFVFQAVLLSNIEWKVKEKKPLERPKIVKRKLTVSYDGELPT